MNRGILALPGGANRSKTVPFGFCRDTFRTRDVALPALFWSGDVPMGPRRATSPLPGFRMAIPLAMSEPGAAALVFALWLAIVAAVLVIAFGNRR